MTKRYVVLQKKLEELESSLAQLFSLRSETTACHHLLSDDFHQRFLFLTNLLQAEIASHPSKPRHLAHIAHRLTQLESAFCDWDLHRTGSNHLDAIPNFSCTESCLDEDGEEEEEEEEEEEKFYEVVEEEPGEVVGVERSERDVERGSGGRRWLGVVVGAVVMSFVMVRFSDCFDYVEYQACLVPT